MRRIGISAIIDIIIISHSSSASLAVSAPGPSPVAHLHVRLDEGLAARTTPQAPKLTLDGRELVSHHLFCQECGHFHLLVASSALSKIPSHNLRCPFSGSLVRWFNRLLLPTPCPGPPPPPPPLPIGSPLAADVKTNRTRLGRAGGGSKVTNTDRQQVARVLVRNECQRNRSPACSRIALAFSPPNCAATPAHPRRATKRAARRTWRAHA